ncbi:MAG TPA: Calx-beta domain-containing protein [Acidimicrobiia bacterium]|nr:Calx-beta domain-containing protein [Acidimicrobiia bacterium]
MRHQLARLGRSQRAVIALITVLALLVLAPAALSRPTAAQPSASQTAASQSAQRVSLPLQVVTPDVTVAATDGAAAEAGADTGTFTVTRTGPTTAALTVNFTLGGTAVAGDYNAISSPVTILAGQASAAVTVTPVNDLLPEDSETVILTVTGGTGYNVGTPSSATVNIADNDPPVVSIAATDSSASETGPNPGTFTVSRTGSTTNALTVNYTIGGTASNGSDYSLLATSVVIPATQSSAVVTVTPTNDAVAEPTETVILTLAAGSYTIGSPAAATVNIADNDAVTVSVTATDDSAAEAGPNPGVFTITRTGDLTAALTVNYTVGGSATAGSDYAALPLSVVIAAGQASATVVVNPIDDAAAEGQETVILNLAAGAYSIGSPSSDDVKIADNDGTAPTGNMPANKDQCKKGGWQTFGVFKNQGDCVSWVATGGKNPPAG